MALNSKETALVVASILFPFLAAFFTILRFRARSKSLAPRKADDYWLVAATVCRPDPRRGIADLRRLLRSSLPSRILSLALF
jgi:hypothetical protein